MTFNRTEHLNRARQIKIDNLNRNFWQRFWSRVNKNGPIPAHRPDLGPCWLWTGSVNTDGYGQVKHIRIAKMVHRVSFESHFGPIPDGLQVCHHCDNPPCVNWNHHFLGTTKDNVYDSIAKNRRHYHHGDTPRRKGELNGRAKLTDELVRQLRQMDWSKKGSQSAKAEELGISWANFHMMLRRKTWRHIP